MEAVGGGDVRWRSRGTCEGNESGSFFLSFQQKKVGESWLKSSFFVRCAWAPLLLPQIDDMAFWLIGHASYMPQIDHPTRIESIPVVAQIGR